MSFFGPTLHKLQDCLAVAAREIHRLEAELSEASLEAAMSNDWSAADLIRRDLREARERTELLKLAVVEAERQEAEKLEAARAKEHKAKIRAFRAHLARLEKAAGDFEVAVAAMQAAWRVMHDAAGNAICLLPGAASSVADEYGELFEHRLRRLGEVELARVGRVADHLGSRPFAPGSDATPLGGVPHHELQPISEAVKRMASRYGEKFAATLGAAPPPKATKTKAKARERSEHVPSDPVTSAQAAAPTRQISEVIALASGSQAANPHPEGSAEAAGYEAAMREMQSHG